MISMALPDSYRPATWRCTTRVDDIAGVIGIAFTLPDGSVARFALQIYDALYLAGSISGFSTDHFKRCHSSISSGMPSVDVSVPHDGENV